MTVTVHVAVSHVAASLSLTLTLTWETATWEATMDDESGDSTGEDEVTGLSVERDH